jgi:hypothetical protein
MDSFKHHHLHRRMSRRTPLTRLDVPWSRTELLGWIRSSEYHAIHHTSVNKIAKQQALYLPFINVYVRLIIQCVPSYG